MSDDYDGAEAAEAREMAADEHNELRALLIEVLEAWPTDTVCGQVPPLSQDNPELFARIKAELGDEMPAEPRPYGE